MNPKNILIVNAYPNFQSSHSAKVTADFIAKTYSKHTITTKNIYQNVWDIQADQAILEIQDIIIFQFPVYWFFCPYKLQQWLEEVWTYNFAFNDTNDASGFKLAGKKIACVFTSGSSDTWYKSDAYQGKDIHDIVLPIRTTATFCRANFVGSYAFSGIRNVTDITNKLGDGKEFGVFLSNLLAA
jgi:putative NADPH-quinone reductase